jgi:hypothetical protein
LLVCWWFPFRQNIWWRLVDLVSNTVMCISEEVQK